MNNKRTLVNLYKDIVLVTRVHIFCTTLFTNNNIEVVIQMHIFLMDQLNLIKHIFIMDYNHILCTELGLKKGEIFQE